MKLMMGPTFATCSASANHPHSNTAATTPNDEATDSRYPPAAVSGTQIERKTIISRMRERPTTNRPNGSSAAPSWSEMSMVTAVYPVTSRRTPNWS